MGLKKANVSEDDNDDYNDDTPVVDTGYYWGVFKPESSNFYEKDGDQKVILNFEIEAEVDGDTETVEVPYFLYAKVSSYQEKDSDFASSSAIGKILESIDAVEVFDQYVDADGNIVSGDAVYEVELDNESDQKEFLGGLKAAMSGRRYKLNVKKIEKEDEDGYSNLVDEIEEVEQLEDSAEEVDEGDSGEEDDEEETLFGDEDDVEEESDDEVMFGDDEDEEEDE